MRGLKGSKGAGIVIMVGILVIFIAIFFMLFVFDMLIYGSISCLTGAGSVCEVETLANSAVGVLLVILLVIMIAAALYFMFMASDLERLYKYTRGPKPERGNEQGMHNRHKIAL